MSPPAFERPQDRPSHVAPPIMGIGPPENPRFTSVKARAIAHNDLAGARHFRPAHAPSTRFARNRIDPASQIFFTAGRKRAAPRAALPASARQPLFFLE